jgi:hypothetical protein
MADLTITAANVTTTATNQKLGKAGATITAGEGLYQATDGTLHPAKADTTVDAAFVGIALNGGSTGQPISYQPSGLVTIGATPVVCTIYVVSAANPGGIAPWADLASTNKLTVIGYGYSATQLMITPIVTGLAIP